MSEYKWSQDMKFIISPEGDEIEWCYADRWLCDLSSDVLKLEKENQKLKKGLEECVSLLLYLYKDEQLKESSTKHWSLIRNLLESTGFYKVGSILNDQNKNTSEF